MSLSEVDIFREYAMTQSDIELGEPATEQEIGDFEIQYGVKFPADVREFFLKINGVYVLGLHVDVDLRVDSGFVAIDSLSKWRLATEYDNYTSDYLSEKFLGEANHYFHFGNYDISAWDWFIKLNTNPEVETPIVVILDKTTKVGENFTDFL